MTDSTHTPPISLVFMGTPALAVPALKALAADPRFKVLCTVTQPDKPAGRGQKLTPPPVKVISAELNLPVFQPSTLKGIELAVAAGSRTLRSTGADIPLVEFLNSNTTPDLLVVVAYGKLIPRSLLDFPRHGAVNAHFSLLPRWRGAAPIQQAIFAGDRETGVTMMQLDEGLDTGPILAVRTTPIHDSDDVKTLSERLAALAADLLTSEIPGYVSGKTSPIAQPTSGVSYANKWSIQDSIINWSDPAAVTALRVRASDPEPGARAMFEGEPVKIFHAEVTPNKSYPAADPGTIVEVNRLELVVAGPAGSYIALDQLQFPGKKRLSVRDILNGRSIKVGARFTTASA